MDITTLHININSICDNLRHFITRARAGFEPAQWGHICSLPGALTIRPPDSDDPEITSREFAYSPKVSLEMA